MPAAWSDTEPAQRGGGFRQPLGEPAQGEGPGCVVELVKPAVAFAGACERLQPPLPDVVEVVFSELDMLGVLGPFQAEMGEGSSDHGEVSGWRKRVDPREPGVRLRSSPAAQYVARPHSDTCRRFPPPCGRVLLGHVVKELSQERPAIHIGFGKRTGSQCLEKLNDRLCAS